VGRLARSTDAVILLAAPGWYEDARQDCATGIGIGIQEINLNKIKTFRVFETPCSALRHGPGSPWRRASISLPAHSLHDFRFFFRLVRATYQDADRPPARRAQAQALVEVVQRSVGRSGSSCRAKVLSKEGVTS
jgi:hypothetical protein